MSYCYKFFSVWHSFAEIGNLDSKGSCLGYLMEKAGESQGLLLKLQGECWIVVTGQFNQVRRKIKDED